MPGNQSSHEKDSKAFILWIKVGKEVEFAKFAAITYVLKYLSSDIFNEPATIASYSSYRLYL